MRLWVFGNEYLEGDGFAHEVAAYLDGVEVVPCRSPEDLLDLEEDPLIILDVVKNAESVIVFEDPGLIKTRNFVSLHDLDLGFFLKLREELGASNHAKVIGIPEQGIAWAIAQEVAHYLEQATGQHRESGPPNRNVCSAGFRGTSLGLRQSHP